MRRTVRALLAASTGCVATGCALLVSFDGLDDGGIDASSDRGIDVIGGEVETADSADAPDDRTGGETSQDSGPADASDSAVDTGGGTGGDAGGGDASTLFLGCFQDSSNRDLPYQAYDSQLNTSVACITACIAKGYLFAGTQSGSQCFCGDAYGGQGPAGDCTTPCTGDSETERCGGNYQNSVYVAIGPAPRAKYVGCYADGMMRELPYQVFGGPYTTVENCAAGCAYHGYLYSGPENGNQCFCGDSYGTLGDSGGCTSPCNGDAAEFCGGNFANSVYRTWAAADAGSDASDGGGD